MHVTPNYELLRGWHEQSVLILNIYDRLLKLPVDLFIYTFQLFVI